MTFPPESKVVKRAFEGETDVSGRHAKRNRTESLHSISENGNIVEQMETGSSIDTRWPSSTSNFNSSRRYAHDSPLCLAPDPSVNISSTLQPEFHGVSPADPVPAIIRHAEALTEDTQMMDSQVYPAISGNGPATAEVEDTIGDLMRVDDPTYVLNINDKVGFFEFGKFDAWPAQYPLPSVIGDDTLYKTLDPIDSRNNFAIMTFEPQFDWCSPTTSHLTGLIPAVMPETTSSSAPLREEHEVCTSALEFIDQPVTGGDDFTGKSTVVTENDCNDLTTKLDADQLNLSSNSLNNHIDPCQDQYDACFGVIVADVVSSFTGSQGGTCVPVTTRRFGDMIKLNFQNSNKYAGIIKLPILGEILEEFNVKFAATLVSLVSQPGKSRSKKSMRNLQRSQNCSARIVVYGLQCEKSAVGNILSDAGVYLQQPTVAECDKNIAYANPHYLIRPGSQMPDLEESPTLSDDRSNPGPERLNEVDKGRLMRIFDFANADNLRPPITPSPRLRSCLKDHQLSALVMMIEKECGTIENLMFPSLWQLSTDSGVSRRYRHAITGALNTDPTPLRGGILADDMGLGKTLSTLALICSSIDTQTNQNGSSADGMTLGTLIVTPKSTIPGWKQQIARHIRPACVRVIVYHGSTRQRMHTELEGADIVLTTYETLRAEWMTKGALYSEKWHRLVLDEAHRVRSRASQIFKAACAVVSRYRWCLTGTPIQNSLDDYGALLSFLGVPPFTEKSMFDFWIASPLTERRVGSLESLQSLVRATCLRRTKKMIGNTLELPRRLEEIEKVDFYHADDELYTFFKESTAKVASRLSSRNPGNSTRDFFQESNIISLMNFLRLICDHGKNLLPTSALAAWEARDRTSIDWRLMRNSSNRCDICDAEIERSDSGPNAAPHLQHGQIICTKCTSEYRDSPIDEARVDRPDDAPEVSTARVPDIPSPAGAFVRPSAKVERLLKNIATEQALNRHINSETIVKSVIFSYWTKMLNLIQQALESEGFCTQRIDGSSSLEQRSEALRRFREDPKCTVMLASIGSAGEGIDLTAASRVHLVEPHWNPMAEAQAVDRVHRIGQTREVVVTRYIMRDSIETYIQWVQQDKLRLINQSLDFDEYSQPRIDMDRWTKLRESLQ